MSKHIHSDERQLEVAPVDGSTKLLDRLFNEAVLPKYAFPTDVATFHVFNRSGFTLRRPVFEYTPSQGLSVALTQYAPGRQIVIDGKRYLSGALYTPFRDGLLGMWARRLLYFECENCHYARTSAPDAGDVGERLRCPACGRVDTLGPAQLWFVPPGFAHPTFVAVDTVPEEDHVTSIATAAKLSATKPEQCEWAVLNARIKTSSFREHLLVTNRGRMDQGFRCCLDCGLIEPSSINSGKVTSVHPKPYPDMKHPQCRTGSIVEGMVLGTDFITDVMLVSIRVDSPLSLMPGWLSTQVALRTLSEALTKATASILELEPSEVQAEFRPALSPLGPEGREAEIYLYDTLAGGAGFTHRIASEGLRLFKDALKMLTDCDCESSCYRCLRSFKNRYQHSLLDRHTGIELLRYLLGNEMPTANRSRALLAAKVLYEDFKRQLPSEVEIRRDAKVDAPNGGVIEVPILVKREGRSWVLTISSSLTPRSACDLALEELADYTAMEILPRDLLSIELNLPSVTEELLKLFLGRNQ